MMDTRGLAAILGQQLPKPQLPQGDFGLSLDPGHSNSWAGNTFNMVTPQNMAAQMPQQPPMVPGSPMPPSSPTAPGVPGLLPPQMPPQTPTMPFPMDPLPRMSVPSSGGLSALLGDGRYTHAY